jgi:hypothetical protein
MKKMLGLILALSFALSLGTTAPAAATEPDLSRIYGEDRIATALALAAKAYTKAGTVVLVAADQANLVDALVVGPLAAQEQAPILPTFKNTLSPLVASKIKALGAQTVIAVGPLTDAVLTELEQSGVKVEVIRGSNRMETAALVQGRLRGVQGSFVVGYNALADAVSVNSFASAKGYAILFADPSGALPPQQKTSGKVYLVGGPALVRDIPAATRIYGSDRFATNLQVLETLDFDFSRVFISNGLNGHLVDALVLSPYASQTGAPVVICDGEALSPRLTALLSAKSSVLSQVPQIIAIGGQGLVPDALARSLTSAPAVTPPSEPISAATEQISAARQKATAYMLGAVIAPQVGSVGGEWAVIGLARGNAEVPAGYYTAYARAVEQYVREHKGVLHERKYTEYSRVILALTAAGYDPRQVGGYDLTLPLADFEKTIWQGINGPIWALIALDSGNYPIPLSPEAPTQATRELYLQEILRRQLPDGGWDLTSGVSATATANADLTGMALQALAKYQEQPAVSAAIDKALACLSRQQDADGGYTSWGDPSSESVVQVLVGLTELGLSADDPRFIKNGHTLIDNILTHQNADGSFRHTGSGAGVNQMATEQVLYGLVAAERAERGQNSLYRMGDAVKR